MNYIYVPPQRILVIYPQSIELDDEGILDHKHYQLSKPVCTSIFNLPGRGLSPVLSYLHDYGLPAWIVPAAGRAQAGVRIITLP